MTDAVENIIAKINEDVERKLSEVELEIEKKIKRIREEELSRWQRERERIEHDGIREIESLRSLIISRAHLDGKRELLKAREEIMNKVVENMKRNARSAKKYGEFLKKAIVGSKEVFGEDFVVVCIPEDKAVVDVLVKKVAPKAKVVLGEVKHGGIIAKSSTGEKSIDYSVDAMVNRRMNEIRRMIVSKLFEGEYA